MKKKYDEHLSFDLPNGYEAESSIGDDGSKSFSINCGTGVNASGEPTAEVRIIVKHLDGAIDPSNVNFHGDFPARTGGSINEMKLGVQLQSSSSSSPGRTLTMQILSFLVGMSSDEDSYALVAIKTGKEDAFADNCALIAKHLNRVLECVRLDGNPGNFQKLTGQDVQRGLKEGTEGKDSEDRSADSAAGTKAQKTGKPRSAGSSSEPSGKAKAIKGVRFFIEGEATERLIKDAKETDPDKVLAEGDEFSFDITEQPFHCEITRKKNVTEVQLYIRNQMGFLEGHADAVVTFPDGGTARMKGGSRIANAEDAAGHFLKTAVQLRYHFSKDALCKDAPVMDPASEGIVVKYQNGACKFREVKGKARPNLACTALFGGIEMGRPYEDEVMEGMFLGDTFEEQLAAAEEGNTAAMDRVAMAYLNGNDEVKADPKKAYYWVEKLAKAGDSDGMFNAALFNAKGFGTPRNFAAAARWAKKALEAGDEDARELVTRYSRMQKNEKKAEEGDAKAQGELAGDLMALAGSLDQAGPGDDYKESVKWAEKAVEQGDGEGCFTLALAYEHGRGVRKNMKKAAELYQKGADLGHPRCMNSLGAFYINGTQVPKYEMKGFEWIQKSAKLGDAEGMANLGRCYQFGTGTTDSMSKAIEWYEKSLEIRPDAELERKVQVFKMLEGGGPGSYHETSREKPVRKTKAEKEEEERKKKEKAAAEELARKAREEARKKEEKETAERKKQSAEWKAEKERIVAERNTRLRRSAEEYLRKVKEAEDLRFEELLKKEESKLSELKARKAELEEALGKLGLFAMSKKKETRMLIAETDNGIKASEGMIEQAKQDHEAYAASYPKVKAAFEEKEGKRLETTLPLPEKPSFMNKASLIKISETILKDKGSMTAPEMVKALEAKGYAMDENETRALLKEMSDKGTIKYRNTGTREDWYVSVKVNESKLMDEIYSKMKDGKSYTMADIRAMFPQYELSPQEWSAAVTKMRKNIRVSREMVRGIAYFTKI